MVQDSIKMILRWSKMALRWSKRVPREPQDEASWAKMSQDCSKIAPTKSQNRPRWLKDVARWSFGTWGCCHLRRNHIEDGWKCHLVDLLGITTAAAVTISERRKRVNLRSFDLAQSTMNVVRFAFGLLLLRFCVAFASLLLCFCLAFAFAFVLLLCCLCFPNGGAPLSYKALKELIRPLRFL